MNFIIFNVILFIYSYIIDYFAVDLYGLEEWSMKYIQYLFLINLPISTILTYMSIGKIKEYLGVDIE